MNRPMEFSHIICFCGSKTRNLPRQARWQGTELTWSKSKAMPTVYFSGVHSPEELLNSSDRTRLWVGDFQNLPSQLLKAQYNEIIYRANRIHMFFKGKPLLTYSKQHMVSISLYSFILYSLKNKSSNILKLKGAISSLVFPNTRNQNTDLHNPI